LPGENNINKGFTKNKVFGRMVLLTKEHKSYYNYYSYENGA